MVWFRDLPPVSGAGSDGAPSENSLPPNQPPVADSSVFEDPSAMSDYLHGPFSNWLSQNAGSFSSKTFESVQELVNTKSAALHSARATPQDGVDAYNEILSELGLPVSTTAQAAQIGALAKGIDQGVQSTLASLQDKISPILNQVQKLQAQSDSAPQSAAIKSVKSLLSGIQGTINQWQSQLKTLSEAANNVSDIALNIQSQVAEIQSHPSNEALRSLQGSFQELQGSQNIFQNSFAATLYAATRELNQIHSLITTKITPAATPGSSTTPSTALYNAMSLLWSLFNLYHPPQNNPQAMQLLAQAIQQINSQLPSDPGSSDPDSSTVYQILHATIPGCSPLTLASICGTATSPNANAASVLQDVYMNLSNPNFQVTINNGQSNTLLGWLNNECNSASNWFDAEYADNKTNPQPIPYPTPPATVLQDYSFLQTDIQTLQNETPGTPQYNRTLQMIVQDINTLMKDIGTPTNGYTQFLYNYLSQITLDGTNSFASLAQGAAAGNASDLAALGSFLYNTNYSNDLGNAFAQMFNNIDPDGPNAWWPPSS